MWYFFIRNCFSKCHLFIYDIVYISSPRTKLRVSRLKRRGWSCRKRRRGRSSGRRWTWRFRIQSRREGSRGPDQARDSPCQSCSLSKCSKRSIKVLISFVYQERGCWEQLGKQEKWRPNGKETATPMGL